jgi:4-hydroxy-tetrahydrodipicolinate synthase
VTTSELPGGIYPYLVSPIGPDGAVDRGGLHAIVDHLIASGVHGLSPLGSTGEVMYLTAPQRAAIVEATITAAARRVPVVPGVSAFATHDAVEQARRYEALGASGIVLMRQHAFEIGAAGIVSYFADVAAAVSLPIVLYTNPSVLGGELPVRAIAELAEVPNIRYVKDASGNTGRILSILEHTGGRIGVYSASAHIPLVVFELGGIGWMAGPACVVPDAAVEMHRRFLAGDRAAAAELQRAMWPLNEVFTSTPLGACIKAALTLRGFPVGDPIPPQGPLAGTDVARLRAVLDRVDAALTSVRARVGSSAT